MKRRTAFFFVSILLPILALTACNSTVQQVKPEQTASLQPGSSSKAQVIEILGLPQDINRRSNAEGKIEEVWLYYREPDKQDVLLPIAAGVVGDVAFVALSDIDFSDPNNPVAVALMFDETGLLVDIKP